MNLKKYFAVAAACSVAAISAVLPVSATFTEAPGSPVNTLPQIQAPPPTNGDAVPGITFNGQSETAASGAVLGNSTPSDSASTGDTGVLFAVAGLFVTAGVGAAAVALKNRKK